jgi:hyperosmotically inducible protein
MKTLILGLLLATGAFSAVRTAEEKLIHQVRQELVTLPFYGVFDNLMFELRGRTVVLKGQVARPTLKPDAERVVREVEGVENVVNEIEVLPLSPNDDRIRIATYRAVYSDNVLYRYALQAVPPIHIIVKNGNVTLVGVVANATDKNVAGLRANAVNGVFSVSNELRIDGGK